MLRRSQRDDQANQCFLFCFPSMTAEVSVEAMPARPRSPVTVTGVGPSAT